MYHKIPDDINPLETSAKITYANSFQPKLSLLLRERGSPSLTSMQEESLEVETNILVVDRLKNKYERGDKEKKKQKEEKLKTSCTCHNYEDKFEEMTKLIKGLSSKLAKMEVDNKNANIPT